MISLNLIIPIQFNMTEIKNTLRRMKPNTLESSYLLNCQITKLTLPKFLNIGYIVFCYLKLGSH